MDEIVNDDQDVAISVTDVQKSFRLPRENHSGIKQALINVIRRNRRKGYENQHVLKGISFEVRKGDFYGIVGRNGSGKSTLLKLLAGIYSPDQGAIAVSGSLVPFIELGVGFNPELSGRDNVYLNGALLGFSRRQMDAMYDEIVEFAELGRFMDQKLKNYSSGMQVRLAFSIAIRAKSDVLLLDEVLAVGDEAFQKKCNNYFAKIKKDRTKTVILVTHSMDSVRRYCNRALLIDKGEIVVAGDPNEVADEYSKQFIANDSTSIKEKNRLGTGEVVYKDVDYSLTSDSLILDVTIVNRSAEVQTGITMGFDFCINDEIITGIDTRYIERFKSGIILDAGQEKRVTLTFPNTFGNYTFTLNTNITTDMGINVTDHIRPALSFDSNNVRYSNAFKVLAFPVISEKSGND